MRFILGRPHETENKVRLGLPRIIQRKENAPEFDYSSFYVTTGMGHTGGWTASRSLMASRFSPLTMSNQSLNWFSAPAIQAPKSEDKNPSSLNGIVFWSALN